MSSAATPGTLVIDEANWPVDDANQLYAVSIYPWPNWLTYTVYQPLVSVNSTAEFHTGKIQYLPGLAANWTTASDNTVYTFNLRHGVKFSNGDPFNAYQLWMEMYGFYYLSGNSSTWLESYVLFDMSSASFGPSTISLIGQGGLINPTPGALGTMTNSSWPIYVTGPYQIVFHIKSPYLFFPGLLTTYEGLVFDSQYVLDHGEFGTSSAFNSNFNQDPILGSGPYVVTHVAVNSFISFTQDPTYWGRNLTRAQLQQIPIFDPGHVKDVLINYKPDDLTRYIDLSNGAAQISMILSSNWNLVQANSAKYSYVSNPPWAGEINAIALNSKIYPTNITAVRNAIIHAHPCHQLF